MLSYRTAGESHGRALITLIEGMPAGVPVDVEFINAELRRRQGGYGRGGRQKIETDHVEFLSGVRIKQNHRIADRDDDPEQRFAVGRSEGHAASASAAPGHADLAGSVKWLTTDCRETLERASAGKPRRALPPARFHDVFCANSASKCSDSCALSERQRRRSK